MFQKLKNAYDANKKAGKETDTLKAMLERDIEAGTAKKDPSAGVALLWYNRSVTKWHVLVCK